jgi:hypothetical protein
MGSCGAKQRKKKQKKYSIKLKGLKRRQKNKVEDVSFDIIDTNNNKTKQKIIKNNSTLSELLSSVNYNINGDIDITLKDKTKLNEDLNTNLKDIIDKYFYNTTLLSLPIFVTNKGLSIPSNIKKSYQEMSPIIGIPIFEHPEHIELSLYYTKTKNLETFYFKKNEYKSLMKFNFFSSYCNANGMLYISGGENVHPSDINEETEEYNDFVLIDMNTVYDDTLKVKKLPNLLVKRTWHSMIFVPNQYIFIVGGESTKMVEFYDLDKNEIYLDSELKSKRCEPTLCLVNNIYLYAFCGFRPYKNFNYSIERCNLLKKKREWEFFDFSNNINPSFFGISYYKTDEICLISSKDSKNEENKSYSYKIGEEEDDEIKEIMLKYNGLRLFKDKLFYPVSDCYAVNLPLNMGKKKYVLFLNIDKGDIECKYFE